MVDAEIVSRRLLILNNTLARLANRAANITGEALASDELLQASVERWMQVAIEACVDLAYHVIADGGWVPAENARTAFVRLAEHGVIDNALAARLGLAAGLRNILVHEYADVDLEKLASAARSDTDELRRFGAAIVELIAPSSGG